MPYEPMGISDESFYCYMCYRQKRCLVYSSKIDNRMVETCICEQCLRSGLDLLAQELLEEPLEVFRWQNLDV